VTRPHHSHPLQAERDYIDRFGLAGFVKRAWGQVVTCQYKHNWHHDIVIDALERVSRGELRKVAIWVPPGTTKTLLCDVFWPAWDWLKNPERHFLSTTYGGSLALKSARQMRDLVNSDWYQRLTGGDVKIPYQNTHAAAWFQNNRKGSRFSGSVRGEVTGRHFDIISGDDLNKAIDAYSLTGKSFEEAWLFWDEVLATRQTEAKTTARVQIGQRLHVDDVGGRWLKKHPEIEVVCLPMRFEAKHPHRHPGDPRTVEGELLWPERFGEEEVRELEKSPTMAAAQLQQRPIPPGGQLLKDEYMEHRYTHLPSALQRAIQDGRAGPGQMWRIYVDATFKGKPTSDFVVAQLWCRNQGLYYIVDQIRGQWGFKTTKERLREFAARYACASHTKIEDAANAAAIEDDMKGQIKGLALAPVGGGVLARCQQVEGLWASGAVLLPAEASWLGGSDGFIAEHLGYDGLGTRHDDQVSASSLALLDLSSGGATKWAEAFRGLK
jgi:predicted phage terminase large subunit-like protein